MPGTLRLFVALLLPEEIRKALEHGQNQLRRSVPPGCVAWARPEQFHLTLQFLGEVEEQRAAPLTLALRQACERNAPLRLQLAGIGFFPNPQRPRVVWAGVQDADERLWGLQRAVAGAVAGFEGTPGAATEDAGSASGRPFTGHITLGRVKHLNRNETGGLLKTAQDLAGTSFGECVAGQVDLMQSQISPAGAQHTSLSAIRLAG